MLIDPTLSHLDHGLPETVIQHLAAVFASADDAFITTIELPLDLGLLDCQLVGPAVGGAPVSEQDVVYHVRGSRPYASRMLREGAERPCTRTRLITVIAGPAGPDDGLMEHVPCVLYTAFAGPLAPREPGDPGIGSWDQLMDSRVFWAQHALRP